jgi:rhodanese-related sulfurtransferase
VSFAVQTRRVLARDFCGVIVLAIVSAAAGVAWNRLHGPSIPLAYQTPAQRLDAQLTSLIKAPPFHVTELQTIGIRQFQTLVHDKGAVILDARAAPFYQQGHVPGAINLARDDFARDYQSLAPRLKPDRDRLIVVYCSGGECHDSKLVASALMSLGFSDVRVFTGGWEQWTQAGLPVATK